MFKGIGYKHHLGTVMADGKHDYRWILDTLLLETLIFAVYGIFRWLQAPRWTALVACLINLSVIFLYGKVMLSRIDRDAHVAAQKRAKQQALAMEERWARHANGNRAGAPEANDLCA